MPNVLTPVPRLTVPLVLLAALVLLVPVLAQAQQLAFPTAEGAGRFSTGGRGGKAYNINSLSNGMGSDGSCNAGGCGGDGPFSPGTVTFRDCLHDRFGVGARTCIFRMGGRIDFPCNHEFGAGNVYLGTQSCKVYNPYITIAGQTAPGDGIMLSSMNLGFEGNTAHDVIMRHMRIRTGLNVPQSCCCPDFCPDGNTLNAYGYTPNPAYNIIFDHVSLGWGRDDTVVLREVRDVTLQHILWSEGLGNGSSDPSKVLSTGRCTTEPTQRISILHSLLATYSYRAPNIGGCNVEVVNTIIYGVYSGPQVFPYYDPIKASFVNNYLKPNANGQDPNWDPYIQLIGCGFPGLDCTNANNSLVEVHGNLHSIQRPTLAALSEPALVYAHPSSTLMPVQTTSLGLFDAIPTQTTAAQAYLNVLHQPGFTPGTSGAGVRVPTQDSIDQRAISDVLNGTGSPLTNDGDEAYYGGFPTYASGTPYPDTDGDGISDAWETAHGLNPNDASDGPALHANGYSNLENFLNELAGDTVFANGSTAPTVTIDTPTTAPTWLQSTYTLMTLEGPASDDVGVFVSWSCPTCTPTGSWTACTGCGTPSARWSVPTGIGLSPGVNTITVTAVDDDEQGATDVLTVVVAPLGTLLDDFNRANEGPPPSANWSGPLLAGQGSLEVLDTTLVVDTTATSSVWWNAQTFPADVGVSVLWADATVSAPRHARLFLRMTQPGVAGQTDGYFCQAEPSPTVTNGALYLRRVDNDTATGILAQNLAVPWATGDSMKCEMIGAELCGYRLAAGSDTWTQLVCLTDATYGGGGSIGVGQNHPETALDDLRVSGLAATGPTLSPVASAYSAFWAR